MKCPLRSSNSCNSCGRYGHSSSLSPICQYIPRHLGYEAVMNLLVQRGEEEYRNQIFKKKYVNPPEENCTKANDDDELLKKWQEECTAANDDLLKLLDSVL